MQNFSYSNPCSIHFGDGVCADLGEALSVFGRRTLFVYGRGSIKCSGLYDKIVSQLSENGIAYIEHGDVKSNPVLSHVYKGIALVKEHGIDSILAVGGGSVIDEAKAIAFGALEEEDIWHFFSNTVKPQKALPVVTVLTIFGSGSEVNPGTVLTNDTTNEKCGLSALPLIPRVSFLDPLLTFTVPEKHLTYGFIDAFSHVIEGYLNCADCDFPIQDAVAESVMRNIVNVSLKVKEEPPSYRLMADAMWTSALAHNGQLNMGRGKISFELHNIAHLLGACFDIHHGVAIGLVLLPWLITRRGKKSARVSNLGRMVFDLTAIDEGVLFDATIDAISSYFSALDVPVSLSEYIDTPKDECCRVLDKALRKTLPDLEESDILTLLNMIVTGVN